MYLSIIGGLQKERGAILGEKKSLFHANTLGYYA